MVLIESGGRSINIIRKQPRQNKVEMVIFESFGKSINIIGKQLSKRGSLPGISSLLWATSWRPGTEKRPRQWRRQLYPRVMTPPLCLFTTTALPKHMHIAYHVLSDTLCACLRSVMALAFAQMLCHPSGGGCARKEEQSTLCPKKAMRHCCSRAWGCPTLIWGTGRQFWGMYHVARIGAHRPPPVGFCCALQRSVLSLWRCLRLLHAVRCRRPC